jgi:RNA polymerase sigma factor (sigma-70 family)
LSESILYTEPNAVLIEECRQGKNAAFKQVYDLYSDAMYTICSRMLNDKEESKDVLQESFISAFKNIHQYNGKASFGSWLKRIVINGCIAVIKKRNQNLIPLAERDLPEEEPDEETGIIYTVEDVKAAVSELPDGYRIILTLYLFENYSHKMIAEKLNISEGTSKSQYSRARKKLIELIRKHDYEGRNTNED